MHGTKKAHWFGVATCLGSMFRLLCCGSYYRLLDWTPAGRSRIAQSIFILPVVQLPIFLRLSLTEKQALDGRLVSVNEAQVAVGLHSHCGESHLSSIGFSGHMSKIFRRL